VGFSGFFLLFWSVDLGFYGDFLWGFDVFLFGLNGVLGPWRQERQAECASSGNCELFERTCQRRILGGTGRVVERID